MKNFKNGIISGGIIFLAAATFMASTVTSVFAQDDIKYNSPIREEVKTGEVYNFITGTVKQVDKFVDNFAQGEEQYVEGWFYVYIEDEDNGEARILITTDTYIIEAEEIEVNDKINAFYDANAPMLMIYPPQYTAEVIAVIEPEKEYPKADQTVKVGLFDEDLLSADESLKLNISEETEIISQDGQIYEGELSNKRLVVIYEFSTFSLPAQTTPIKVIVLNDKAEIPSTEEPEIEYEGDETGVVQFEEPEDVLSDELVEAIPLMDIVVEGNKITAPAAYVNEDKVVMVPLRAIAEALGHTVGWDSETQSISVGRSIYLTVGKDYYVYLRTAPIHLGVAPELIDNAYTYVPLSFFKRVVRVTNAYVFEGQIVIDNFEEMN